ncbi:hypothetical protein PybrP1_010054 [[Pythium] brassicae (nom. inval.)]|nr:hypothetical protein PybrP1_010054 [[Pythium] brassicae (nom. inval.)]
MHTCLQRAELAHAIAVPKVLHSSPALSGGAARGWRRRAWTRAEQAELAPADGGIGCPGIVAELIVLSASTLFKWATNASRLERHMCDALMQQAGLFLRSSVHLPGW